MIMQAAHPVKGKYRKAVSTGKGKSEGTPSGLQLEGSQIFAGIGEIDFLPDEKLEKEQRLFCRERREKSVDGQIQKDCRGGSLFARAEGRQELTSFMLIFSVVI